MNIYKDFDLFTRMLIGGGDHDPVYPLVKDVTDHYGFDPEWFTFVYVAFYNLESAIKFCQVASESSKFSSKVWNIGKLRFGHERRGNIRNIVNLTTLFQSVRRNKISIQESLKKEDNKGFRKFVETIPFHGGWSSFKIAEIFEKSFGYENLSISDLGLDGRDPNSNDGPIGGLRHLYGRDNTYDKGYFPVWNRFGENLAKAYGVGMGEIETCLCKFHKTVSGKYFVGHDVQEFIELKPVLGEKVYNRIMLKNFNPVLWADKTHFEKEHKNHYQRTGKLINQDFLFQNKYPEVDVYEILMKTK